MMKMGDRKLNRLIWYNRVLYLFNWFSCSWKTKQIYL